MFRTGKHRKNTEVWFIFYWITTTSNIKTNLREQTSRDKGLTEYCELLSPVSLYIIDDDDYGLSDLSATSLETK